MDEVRVTGLRGVELNVFDLNESAEFYRKAWGLEVSGTRWRHHVFARLGH